MRASCLAAAAVLLLSGCQHAPSHETVMNDPGMVIGTLSYQAHGEPSHALVRLTRISAHASTPQAYLLDAAYDTGAAHAVFAGSLPSGVYVVEDALSDDARYVPGTMKLPFEIREGQVTDAGNYPMEQRAALLRTTLAQ